MVWWKKGLKDDEEVKKFIKDQNLTFPLVIHFRTASIGGVLPELTHPFPTSGNAPLWLSGYAPEVLFHNGTISQWDDLVLNVGLKSTEKFPTGEWSDSRALAWLVQLKGSGILDFVIKQSRVLTFFAEPETLGTKDYDPAEDHFGFWGDNWIHKKGYSQSITTDHGWNRGSSRNLVATASPASPPVTVYSSSRVGQYPSNTWSIGELVQLLNRLEEEQRSARVAAGV